VRRRVERQWRWGRVPVPRVTRQWPGGAMRRKDEKGKTDLRKRQKRDEARWTLTGRRGR